jgi:hypothetical protein
MAQCEGATFFAGNSKGLQAKAMNEASSLREVPPAHAAWRACAAAGDLSGLVPQQHIKLGLLLQPDTAVSHAAAGAMIDIAKLAFESAVWLAGHEGDKRPLLDLLRSNYPLSAEDKKYLADFIDGKVKRPRGRRPWRATDELRNPDSAAVRRAASFVRRFKEAARKEGRSSIGIHEWAVDQTMDFLEKHGFRRPPPQRLDDYLRRSKKPRKKVAR